MRCLITLVVLLGASSAQAADRPLRAALRANMPGAHWRAMPKGVGNGNVGAKAGRLTGMAGGLVAGYYGGPIAGAVAGRVGANLGERVGRRVGRNTHARMVARDAPLLRRLEVRIPRR